MCYLHTYRTGAVLLLLICPSAFAQGSEVFDGLDVGEEIVVAIAGDTRIQALPGATIPLAVEIRNESPVSVELQSRVQTPEAWMQILPGGVFQLGPYAKTLRLLNIRIPEWCPQGEYITRVIVSSTSGSGVFQTDLAIEVENRPGLRLDLHSAPRFAPSSKPYDVEFIVRNTGNINSAVVLAVNSAPFKARLHEEYITVSANSQQPVRVTVTPSRNLAGPSASRIRLSGYLLENPEVKAEAVGRVDVIPDFGSLESLRPRLSFYAKVVSAGDI
ncbi:MAG: hypothetical protein R3284_11955, partial [Rubricoccaceae bacterium]|nr:hypothetical protein [Rubricoccaceae bacterium]